ncbi:hypothetical protein AOLI_G00120100 [Acnodon oligacanthus]
MIRAGHIIWIAVLCLTGFSHSNHVIQTPSNLIMNQKGSATIECWHNVTNYDQIN